MKRVILLAVPALFLASCENTWDEDSRGMYHQSCMEEARWILDEGKKKAYCDCVLEETMKKYPKVEDVLIHATELAGDPDIQKCKSKAE